jgi:methyl-accepting chemotaxis protein
MSIKNFAWLGAAALCGLMAILTLTAVFGINHIRLGGSLSHSNQLVNDFKADVTPPPTYLVEAFALANVMGIHPESFEINDKRLANLEAEWRETTGKWAASSTDPPAPTGT